jgi:uncharacterized membrane-anchored protein YitT (DUF2179 family)
MYFWNLKALKKEFVCGQLPERKTFAYILATTVVYAVALQIISLSPSEPTIWDWLFASLDVAIVAFGTYLAYKANGSDAGRDFASRYFALGWVITIRIFLLSLPLIFVGVIVAGRWGDRAAESDWEGAVIGLIFEVVLYWQLVHHFGTLHEAELKPEQTA